MAYVVNKLIKTATADSRYLLICGNGHMGFGYGVPERVWDVNSGTKEDSYMIYCRNGDTKLTLDVEKGNDFTQAMNDAFGKEGSPADVTFLFEDFEYDSEDDNKDGEETKEQQVKNETAEAYDKVGESAHFEGNLKKAEKIMSALGYSTEEFEIAGKDAYNFQGVNNPHLLAKI